MPPTSESNAEAARCDAAAVERQRVPGLLAEGKLHRAGRVIARADELCPTEAEASAEHARAIRAELRDGAEFGPALPDTDEAKAPMRATYREAVAKEDAGALEEALRLYLQAWQEWHPNGQALVQAGLVAKKLGRDVAAQRLFDRGLFELERSTGRSAEVEITNGVGSARAVAWSKGGRIAVASARELHVVSQGSLRETVRVDLGGDASEVAFSPDGARVAIAGPRTVHVVDVASGTVVRRIEASAEAGAMRVAFSPDGAHVATATGTEAIAHVWDVETGAERARGKGIAVAFSDDGQRWARNDGDGHVVIASVDGNTETLRFAAPSSYTLSWSPRGDAIASASANEIRLWDARTGQPMRTMKSSVEATSIAFSPDGARLVATSILSGGGVWDVATGARRIELEPRPDEALFGAAFSPDGRWITVATSRGVTVVEAATGRVARRRETHSDDVSAVAWSDRRIAIATERRVLQWGVADGEMLDTVIEGPKRLDYAPDGARLACRASRPSKGEIHVIDATTGKVDRVLAIGSSRPAENVQFGWDGRTLFAPAYDNVRQYDADGDGEPFITPDRGERVTTIAVARAAKRIVAGTERGDILAWDATTWVERPTIARASDAPIAAIAVSSDGALVVASSGAERDGATRGWTEAGEVAYAPTSESPPVARPRAELAIASDGRFVAHGTFIDGLRVWPARGGAALPIRGGPSLDGDERVHALSFSPDGTWLAYADGARIELAHAPTFTRIATLWTPADSDSGVVLTTSGWIGFSGAASARELPTCRVGPIALEFAVCRERFEVEGLLAKVLAGDTSYELP